MKKGAKKKKPEFINREISWLAFNERVLQEAEDPAIPLIERMRFLGIFSNNLDEFFRVRVASLRRSAVWRKAEDQLDFSPQETLIAIRETVFRLQEKYDKTFHRLVSDLKKEKIEFVNETQLSAAQKSFVEKYFETKIRPYLVPLMLSGKNTFPPLSDNSIYLAIELGYKDKRVTHAYALIEIPTELPRFVELPDSGAKHCVMFIEDMVRYRMRRVFGVFDYDKARAYAIKITRDAELDIDDDLSKSVVDKMTRSLGQRKRGEYVRIDYDREMPAAFLEFILKRTKIRNTENIIPGTRYHNKRDLIRFPDFGRPDLCFPPQEPVLHPRLQNKPSVMDEMMKGDILLHFPYHSFLSILDLLREAAIDPQVRTIRISIYRLAKDSQVLNALVNAARNGKRVIAVVEVQARFDEANNIQATQALTEAGARVIPGVPGLKVHSKLIQVSRREGGRTVRYVHIGSGNFHEGTAKVYSDTSLLTCHRDIGREVRKIFEFFESNYTRHVFRHLVVSPFSTRRKFSDLISAEIANARKGLNASIIIKLNNLVDEGMIRKLYEASEAGVRVQLLIRGICCLIPGMPGRSENITVTSILGRYLEHARIIVFENAGNPVYFISSADWMTRNFDYRVEVSTPVYDPALQKELRDYLLLQLSRDARARIIDPAHQNRFQVPRPGKGYDAQIAAYRYFRAGDKK
jgi:polyphosphate kinase